MATYINYGEGEDDAIVQGAEWLQRILQQQQGPEAERAFTEKFKKEFKDAQESNKNRYDYGPVFDLLVEHSKNLFSAIPENKPEERLKEIESFFALILSMLLLLEDTSHLDRATTQLCELFSGDTEQQPELRLRLLMMLYNTFNNPTFEFRYRVFKCAAYEDLATYTLDFAASADMFDQVLPYLDYLESWMADWDATLQMDDKRKLYSDISKYMRNYGKKPEAFQYLKMYHSLFQGESTDLLQKPEVADQTIQLIKDAITLPVVIQFDDILMLDSVKALKGTKQEGLVILCEVFLSGTVDDLKEFQKKNGKLFDEHGLNFQVIKTGELLVRMEEGRPALAAVLGRRYGGSLDAYQQMTSTSWILICQDAMSKIRLLTLATMARGQSELPLDEIAKQIQETPSSVEAWVVRAISEGVIDGRIDQLNRKVLVKSAFLRKFEKEEWNFLDSKLSQWIDNLEEVIKFLGEQKNKIEDA